MPVPTFTVLSSGTASGPSALTGLGAVSYTNIVGIGLRVFGGDIPGPVRLVGWAKLRTFANPGTPILYGLDEIVYDRRVMLTLEQRFSGSITGIWFEPVDVGWTYQWQTFAATI